MFHLNARKDAGNCVSSIKLDASRVEEKSQNTQPAGGGDASDSNKEARCASCQKTCHHWFDYRRSARDSDRKFDTNLSVHCSVFFNFSNACILASQMSMSCFNAHSFSVSLFLNNFRKKLKIRSSRKFLCQMYLWKRLKELIKLRKSFGSGSKSEFFLEVYENQPVTSVIVIGWLFTGCRWVSR